MNACKQESWNHANSIHSSSTHFNSKHNSGTKTFFFFKKKSQTCRTRFALCGSARSKCPIRTCNARTVFTIISSITEGNRLIGSIIHPTDTIKNKKHRLKRKSKWRHIKKKWKHMQRTTQVSPNKRRKSTSKGTTIKQTQNIPEEWHEASRSPQDNTSPHLKKRRFCNNEDRSACAQGARRDNEDVEERTQNKEDHMVPTKHPSIQNRMNIYSKKKTGKKKHSPHSCCVGVVLAKGQK